MTRHARTWLGLLLYMHARTDGRAVVLIRNVHACQPGRQAGRERSIHIHTRTHAPADSDWGWGARDG
jgi:hypothetical protein